MGTLRPHTLETRFSSACVIPNYVALCQIVWAKVEGSTNFGDAGTPPLGIGAWLTPLETRFFITSLVLSCQM